MSGKMSRGSVTVVKLNQEVFTARDDHTVVTRVVGRGIHVEPVDAGPDEGGGIIPLASHVCCQNCADVPAIDDAAEGRQLEQDSSFDVNYAILAAACRLVAHWRLTFFEIADNTARPERFELPTLRFEA